MRRTIHFRRHHQQRMKNRAYRVVKYVWRRNMDDVSSQKLVNGLANDMKKCSCSMCGNFRKHEGITMQEKRMIGDDF